MAKLGVFGAFLRTLTCYLCTQVTHLLRELAVAAKDLGGRSRNGGTAAAQLDAPHEALDV